jgi:hypothetical protein
VRAPPTRAALAPVRPKLELFHRLSARFFSLILPQFSHRFP